MRTRGRYKTYLRDSTAPIPRSTLWRQRKQPATAEFSAFCTRQESSLHDPPTSSEVPCSSHSLSGSPPTSKDPGSLDSLVGLEQGSLLPSLTELGSPPPSPTDQGSPNSDLVLVPPPASPVDPGSSYTTLDLGSPDSLSGLGSPQTSPLRPGSPNSISDQGSPSSLCGLDSSPPQLPSAQEDPELFEPLYPGAEISLCGALCAIMQFCSANRLSYTAIGNLLQLLILICPVANKLPTSFYKFKSFFQQFRSEYDHQKICPQCFLLKEDCRCAASDHKWAPAHLVHISVQKPLQTILSSEF